MPGPLKNARHERFAQELAKGKSKHGAYAAAGYSADRTAACRLSTNANVIARVAQLKAKAAEKVIVTVADIAQQLDEDREFARELENPSAAVSASMGKAKVLGLLEDKTKVDITTLGRPLGLGDFYGQDNERARSDD
jgi:phage terminase small subunit